jgi:hypothetical protein
MGINLAPSVLKVGQVEVASLEMASKLYLHLRIQMNAQVIHFKELEINTCGLTKNN